MAWFNIVNGLPTPPNGGLLRLVLLAIKCNIKSEAFNAVLLYRLACYFRKLGLNLLGHIFYISLQRRYGTTIEVTAEIGGGFRLPHPYGIIIGGNVEIGNMVTVGQHVTLGGNFGSQNECGKLYPSIGSWTWIAAGAVVAGPVRVGEDVVIGANAVVTKDVLAHAIVGGVPAKVIRMRDSWDKQNVNHVLCQYYGYPNEYVEGFRLL